MSGHKITIEITSKSQITCMTALLGRIMDVKQSIKRAANLELQEDVEYWKKELDEACEALQEVGGQVPA
jgi:hypothetical protein